MSKTLEKSRATLQAVVGEAEVGMRLDTFLAQHFELSRRQVRHLLASGGVELEGRSLRESEKGRALARGEQLEVSTLPDRADWGPIPEPEEALAILAEGRAWLAVDKAPGRAVHPKRLGERGSLLNAVAGRFPEIAGVGEGGLRCGVVHRLDRDTSGVLVFALDEERWRELRTAFHERLVEKVYRALVAGLPAEEGEIELPLLVVRHHPALVRAARPGEYQGVRATRLSWRVLEKFSSTALLEVRLETGFLHQIRATFAHLGHPVLGDRAYGWQPDEQTAAIPRSMLHAARLCFRDVVAESPDPPDFLQVSAALRN